MASEAHTPENYANYAGVLLAKAKQDTAEGTLWIDCGDSPATVQEALRVGCTHLVFRGDDVWFAKLNEIAAQFEGAVLKQA